ncbi:unnamed protein product [Tilletia controversa]|uniref:Ribophorin II C-terminal domain-containing protein n=3 Tax=Tilletia TaxID=13289 RepID=A0A8X7N0G4_9BASI|nr:hypothetical protein CF336_g1549 [Tilletia laevis]KAE8205119.1 hypothetical protein CF328_g688 [Tilletia controversa]KAE8264320.1 hypothetical protein A4X03_0g1042 [Tilletia caries]KAE8207709.1 hypothetical protein CF335_g943 [Tilletia laevis]KAE8254087.1 hypothetical protein A4X06_0g1068 [Tilletia controversa]
MQVRNTRFIALLLGAAVAVASVGAAAEWPISAAKLSVQSIDGGAKQSTEFSVSSTLADAPRLSLDPDDVLRVTFTLEGDKSKHPHQVAAVLVDEAEPTVQQTFLIPVKPATGKATWSVRVDRLPVQLLRHIGQTKTGAAEDHLTLRLLVAGYGNEIAPASILLAKLRFPEALTAVGAGAKTTSSIRASKLSTLGFVPHREHKHTFSQPPTELMPAKTISGAAALITVAFPWAFFFVVLVPVLGLQSLPFTGKGAARTAPLLATILALEALALQYWLGLTLFEMIPYLLGGGAVAVFTGRTALIELRARRTASD